MPDLSQSEKFELMFAEMALLRQQLNEQQHQITEQQLELTEQKLLASEQQHQITEQQKTIAQLKEQASSNRLSILEPTPAPARSGLTTTRRKMLGKLAAAMVVGAAAASALPGGEAQARVGIDLKADDGSRRIGAIVVPPGAALPPGTPPPTTAKYGLVATDGSNASFGLASLPGIGIGIYGNGRYFGVYGKSGDTGVVGDGTNTGVYGNSSDTGVSGNGTNIGVSGSGPNTGVSGNGTNIGVSGNGRIGVEGDSTSNDSFTAGVKGTGGNIGVWGKGNLSTSGAGIYGSGGLYSGIFEGNIRVSGVVYGAAKPFKIDHPLDPANKYLHHTAVESPEMTNLYNGIATLDANGEATVTLPDWFETLNRDFRYGLTPIGKASPGLYISQEVSKNSFKIAGGQTGLKVSWQLTGIRQDKWANAHRIPVEEEKSKEEKGLYLHPTLYGHGEDKSVGPKPPAAPESRVKPAAPPETPAAPPAPVAPSQP